LGQDINNGIGRLQNLARDVGKVRDQYERAKELADKANDASFKAFEAAKKCDKATFARLSKEAEKLAEESQKAKDSAEKTEQQLNQQVEETANTVNKHIEGLRNMAEEALKAAEKAGLKEDSAVVGNLRDAQRLLEQEINKLSAGGTEANQFRDEGSLNRFRRAVEEFSKELAKIKEGVDPSKTLKGIGERLDAGAKFLQENCPPKVGALPRKPVEFALALNNQQGTIACVPQGYDPSPFKPTSVLGSDQNGTVFVTNMTPQEVEAAAKEMGLNLCLSFKPEVNACNIKAPLTAFRGHDHKAHRGALHDHDAPDPPWNWGMTPPEMVITWEIK
jgi:hypothetical protein